jgi:hypothetical protein
MSNPRTGASDPATGCARFSTAERHRYRAVMLALAVYFPSALILLIPVLGREEAVWIVPVAGALVVVGVWGFRSASSLPVRDEGRREPNAFRTASDYALTAVAAVGILLLLYRHFPDHGSTTFAVVSGTVTAFAAGVRGWSMRRSDPVRRVVRAVRTVLALYALVWWFGSPGF